MGLTCQAEPVGRWAWGLLRWPCTIWSHTPTMLTTVEELRTGSMWGGMPCQKCNRKLWTYAFTQTQINIAITWRNESPSSCYQMIKLEEKTDLIKVGPYDCIQYPLAVCSVHHDKGCHLLEDKSSFKWLIILSHRDNSLSVNDLIPNSFLTHGHALIRPPMTNTKERGYKYQTKKSCFHEQCLFTRSCQTSV